MRFLTDENVSPKIVEALRSEGYDIFDIKEERLQGMPDQAIVKRARKMKSVIVSEDLDFGNLQRFPLVKHPGAILMHFFDMRPEKVAERLISFIRAVDYKDLVGVVVMLEEDQVKTVR
jgi:predicted nuclease of predicted toxin-antitoxin system